jgi:glycosyltransferase involved in cell wall biosynthesis
VLVGFAGFIRRQKGWPELVAAVKLLVDRGIAIHCVVLGGGVRPPAFFRTLRGHVVAAFGLVSDEESAMHAAVARARLGDRFSFLPFTSDTAAIYRRIDIMTFPNQGVGLGRPVLEAAVYEKPVVASGSRDGGGVLVPDVTGILLRQPTPQAIADALERLALDPALRQRMGNAAANLAAEKFDPKRNAASVALVYDELLGGVLLTVAPAEPVEVGAHSG